MTLLESAPLVVSQRSAPYAEALRRHADRHPLNLMTPGHAADVTGAAAAMRDYFGDVVVDTDVPPLVEGVNSGADNPLLQAEALAADAWGAYRTWFMTNGSSQSNRTATIVMRGLGRDCIIQRSMHSSVVDGIVFAGLNPRFVQPSIDAVHGIAHGVDPATLDDALSRAEDAGHPAASVLIVSPSYFGAVADVEALSQIAHAHGAAFIVDAAWGAHFGFDDRLPESPTRLGADLVVTSTHKLGGSLTQSAMLHLGHGAFATRLEPLVERAIKSTMSTSASSLLLASLDIARRELVCHPEAIEHTIDLASRIRALVNLEPGYALVSDGFDRYDDIVASDPLRIAIDVSATGLSGHTVRARLAAEFAVYVEMSTSSTIVCVIGAGSAPDPDRFLAALRMVARTAGPARSADPANAGASAITATPLPPLPEPGVLITSPRRAYFGETEIVSADEAVGRASADTLAAYPPGIPNILPGEMITSEAIAFLQATAGSENGYVRGAADPQVTTFRVVTRSKRG